MAKLFSNLPIFSISRLLIQLFCSNCSKTLLLCLFSLKLFNGSKKVFNFVWICNSKKKPETIFLLNNSPWCYIRHNKLFLWVSAFIITKINSIIEMGIGHVWLLFISMVHCLCTTHFVNVFFLCSQIKYFCLFVHFPSILMILFLFFFTIQVVLEKLSSFLKNAFVHKNVAHLYSITISRIQMKMKTLV